MNPVVYSKKISINSFKHIHFFLLVDEGFRLLDYKNKVI